MSLQLRKVAHLTLVWESDADKYVGVLDEQGQITYFPYWNADYTAIIDPSGVSAPVASVDSIEAIILANDQLGALSTPIQTLINNSVDTAKDRSQHTGIDPSSNVIMPNGQSLAQWFATMEAFKAGSPSGPDAPVLTTAPTLSIGPQGIIQSGGYETASPATSHPITFTGTMVAGHFGWIGIFTAPGGSITSVTDNLGGVWTAAPSDQGSGTARLKLYYRANIPTGLTGLTVVTPSTEMFAIWQERDDIQLSSPVDVSDGDVWIATTSYTSTATPATTGDGIAIGIAQTESGSGITLVPDSPWETFTGTGLDGAGELHSSALGGFVAAARDTADATTPAFTGTASSTASGWALLVVFKKLSTGAVTVGDDVTITPGSVTNGTGGDHTNEFTVVALDVSTGIETEIPGTKVEKDNGVTTTFKVGATLYQKRFYATQTPIDTVTLQRGNSKSSALSAVVSGTLPSNSVAPDLDPTGSQAAGTELTLDVGTWSNTAEYGIQFVVGGVPIGARAWQTGTTLVFPTNDTYIGLGVTANVIGRSSLGLESAAVNAGNTVTISGSPIGLVYTAAPTWPANLYLGLQADFTEGTVTGTTAEGPGWDFYKNGTNPENKLPRAVLDPELNAHNSISLFTPRAADGFIVGDTVYILEKRMGTDSIIYSTFSSGKAVAAAPATLALTLSSQASAGFNFIAGSPVTAVIVGAIVGGTGPYNVTSSGLASIGLIASVVGSNVVLNGTPTTISSATYSVTLSDSGGGTPVAQSFSITISSGSGIIPLPALIYTDAAVAISGSNTPPYDGITAHTYGGVVVLGPNGDGRNRHRLVQGAPSISGGVRNELLWFDTRMIEGQPWWSAWDILFDIAGEYPVGVFNSYDYFLVAQAHTPLSGNTQPDIACFINRQAGPSVPCTINWRIAGTANAPVAGSTANDSQPAYFGAQDVVQGTRMRFITRHVPGWLASHGPRIDMWVRNGSATSWTQLVTNYTNYPNTYNNGGDTNNRSYVRIGGYKWTDSEWNNTPISWVQSPLYFGRGDNLFDQAAAALAG